MDGLALLGIVLILYGIFVVYNLQDNPCNLTNVFDLTDEERSRFVAKNAETTIRELLEKIDRFTVKRRFDEN